MATTVAPIGAIGWLRVITDGETHLVRNYVKEVG